MALPSVLDNEDLTHDALSVVWRRVADRWLIARLLVTPQVGAWSDARDVGHAGLDGVGQRQLLAITRLEALRNGQRPLFLRAVMPRIV